MNCGWQTEDMGNATVCLYYLCYLCLSLDWRIFVVLDVVEDGTEVHDS